MEYPWGKEYQAGFANVREEGSQGENNLQQTTAVGLYPHGTSTYGVEGMAGNVWEWCLNKYDKAEEIAIDSSVGSRVLRGGSWVDYPSNVRAAIRHGYNPGFRYHYVGFRLSCSLPFSDR